MNLFPLIIPFYLKFVLRSTSFDVQREAARAIANLAAEFEHTAALSSGGALPPLVDWVRAWTDLPKLEPLTPEGWFEEGHGIRGGYLDKRKM